MIVKLSVPEYAGSQILLPSISPLSPAVFDVSKEGGSQFEAFPSNVIEVIKRLDKQVPSIRSPAGWLLDRVIAVKVLLLEEFMSEMPFVLPFDKAIFVRVFDED